MAALTNPGQPAQLHAGPSLSKDVVDGVLNLGEDLKCPICLDLLEDATQLPCCHFFCWECINRTLKKDTIRCPVCKASAKKRDLVRSQLMQKIAAQYNRILTLVSEQAPQPGPANVQPFPALPAAQVFKAAPEQLAAQQDDQDNTEGAQGGAQATEQRRLKRKAAKDQSDAAGDASEQIEDCTAQVAVLHPGNKRKGRAVLDSQSDDEHARAGAAPHAASKALLNRGARVSLLGALNTPLHSTGPATTPDPITSQTPSVATNPLPAAPVPAQGSTPAAAQAEAPIAKLGIGKRAGLPRGAGLRGAKRSGKGGAKGGQAAAAATAAPSTAAGGGSSQLNPLQVTRVTRAGAALVSETLPPTDAQPPAAVVNPVTVTAAAAALPHQQQLGEVQEGGNDDDGATAQQAVAAVGVGAGGAGDHMIDVDATVTSVACTPPVVTHDEEQAADPGRDGNGPAVPAQRGQQGKGKAGAGGRRGTKARQHNAKSGTQADQQQEEEQDGAGGVGDHNGGAGGAGGGGSTAAAGDHNGGGGTAAAAGEAAAGEAAGGGEGLLSPPLTQGAAAGLTQVMAAGNSEHKRVLVRLCPWACPVCTLHNDSGAKKCVVCKTARPKDAERITPASHPEPLQTSNAKKVSGKRRSGSVDRGPAGGDVPLPTPKRIGLHSAGANTGANTGGHTAPAAAGGPSAGRKRAGNSGESAADVARAGGGGGGGGDVAVAGGDVVAEPGQQVTAAGGGKRKRGKAAAARNAPDQRAGPGGAPRAGQQAGGSMTDAGKTGNASPAGDGPQGNSTQAGGAGTKTGSGSGARKHAAAEQKRGAALGGGGDAGVDSTGVRGSAGGCDGGDGSTGGRSKVLCDLTPHPNSHPGSSKPGSWVGMSHCVILGSGLSDEERVELKLLATQSGCVMVDSWRAGITHVTCGTDEQKRARRTIKYLMGIAHGCWVVDVAWVRACLSAGAYVSPDSYEISCDTGGGRGGPLAGRARAHEGAAPDTQLLHGINLVLAGPYANKPDITALAKASGASVLQRPPVSHDSPPSGDKPGEGRKRRASQPRSLAHSVFGTEVAAGLSSDDDQGGNPGEQCSYVLVDAELCASRGVKPLQAASSCVAAGMQVLSYKWLLDCVGSQVVAPVQPHIIT